MKAFLTGVDGQLGFELERALAPQCMLTASTLSGRTIGGRACVPLDLTDSAAIESCLDEARPDVVVNPAAYTAVDRSESESQLAHHINAEAPGAIARWCARNKALLVHYSTDYVFAGQSERPWRENDSTGPLGVYGSSKLAGEEAIRASGCAHLILRTAWVYSARFANFLRTMLRLACERDHLRVVSDQYGTPTTARGLAETTAALLARLSLRPEMPLGTFHLTHAGQTSWHGFAEAIFARAVAAKLLDKSPTLEAIATSEYPTPARRPAYSVLDCTLMRETHGLALPDWQAGLDQVIDELVVH